MSMMYDMGFRMGFGCMHNKAGKAGILGVLRTDIHITCAVFSDLTHHQCYMIHINNQSPRILCFQDK